MISLRTVGILKSGNLSQLSTKKKGSCLTQIFLNRTVLNIRPLSVCPAVHHVCISHRTQRNTLIKSYSTNLLKCTRTFLQVSKHNKTFKHLSSSDVQKHKESGLPMTDPVKGDLVYVGHRTRTVKVLKAFAGLCIIVTIILQPFVVDQLRVSSASWKILYGMLTGYFIMYQPLFIHFLVYRYFSDMYYNKKTKVFTATKVDFLGFKAEFTFKTSDIVYPNIPTKFTRVIVKGQPVSLDQECFIDLNAFEVLMKQETYVYSDLDEEEEMMRKISRKMKNVGKKNS